MSSSAPRALLVTLLLLSAALATACAAAVAEAPAPPTGEAAMMGGGSGGDMSVGVIAAASNAGMTLGASPVSHAGITVARVLAPDNGWVVVRSAVSPGVVLGRAPVKAGETRDVLVRLETLDGPAVRVALHIDRGVRGAFDYDAVVPERSMDKPVFADGLAVEGSVDVPGYGVEASPNSVLILVSDQTVARGAIKVSYLLVPGPSWVCANVIEDGVLGRRVALVSRQAGESQEITVPVPRGLRGPVAVTVFADRGVAGTFEYDASDPLGSTDRPYLSAGVAVSQRITLR